MSLTITSTLFSSRKARPLAAEALAATSWPQLRRIAAKARCVSGWSSTSRMEHMAKSGEDQPLYLFFGSRASAGWVFSRADYRDFTYRPQAQSQPTRGAFEFQNNRALDGRRILGRSSPPLHERTEAERCLRTSRAPAGLARSSLRPDRTPGAPPARPRACPRAAIPPTHA